MTENTTNENLFEEILEGYRNVPKVSDEVLILRSMCRHIDDDGESSLESVDSKGGVKCNICGLEYTTRPISERELEEAIKTVFSALNQDKAFVEKDDRNELEAIFDISYGISSLSGEYRRHIMDEYIRNGGKPRKKLKRTMNNGYGNALAVVRKNRNSQEGEPLIPDTHISPQRVEMFNSWCNNNEKGTE